MNSTEIEQLLNQGVFVCSTVQSSDLELLAKKLAPIATEHELIRLGPAFDGGYLVPNDMNGISACFSPGVSNYAFFEEALFSQFGINSHQADYSVEGPPHGFKPLSFTKKFLGAHNNQKFITLEKWVKDSWESDIPGDFILQMDIEGAEYETLLATPDHIIKRFRIIVLEIHELDKWGIPVFYKIANSMVEKLLQHFIVVHNHPNNHGGLTLINGVEYPRTIEVTLMRKDRCQSIGCGAKIPHNLDAPCSRSIPELILPKTFQLE